MPIRTQREQQSVADYLVRLMPGLDVYVSSKPSVDPVAAKTLFSIWKNENNRLSENRYRKPRTIGSLQLDEVEKSGLAQVVGNEIEITEKGADVIKVMVLGDNSSVFDEDMLPEIDYASALATTKNANCSGKEINKKASNQWWDRYGG